MHTIDVSAGTTDVTVYVKVIDSTDGSAETSVAYDTAGIDLWYMREGADHTAITEASQTAAGAHTDGGFVHITDGWCRLDLPDAACASGVNHVYVGGTITGMIVIGCAINLTAYDPFDSVRMGMTALPNAAADAAGGLPISDAGGLDLDAQIGTDIDAILEDTGTTIPGTITTIDDEIATIDSNVDAILADTGTDGVVVAAASKTGYSLTATTGLGNQTANITGNLSGSVGSVTGAVGSVTGAVGSVTAGVDLADDAITSAKFDESTAFPLGSADTGATAVARVGADSDTLETLSDEIAAIAAKLPTGIVQAGVPKNTAKNDIPVLMVDETDGSTPENDLTVTAYVSKDAGAFVEAAGSVAFVSNGIYQFDATSDDMNADTLIFRFTATGARAWHVVYSTSS